MSAARRTLRRLLRKPAVRRLAGEELERLGPGHAICDLDGSILCGNPALQVCAGEGVPVRLEGALVGRVHGPRGEELARTLGVLASLDAETRAVAGESLARYRELTMLYGLSERIIGAPDVAAIAQVLGDEAMRQLRCDSVTVLLLNPETGRLDIAATRGLAFHSRTSLGVGSDLVGSVIAAGHGEIVNDVEADARTLEADSALRSLVLSPLRAKGKVIGIVVAGTERERHFNAGDLQLLNAMAGQAATAVEAAHLDRELAGATGKPADLIYGLTDRPPLGVAAVLAMQHVFIAMMSLAYPVLVTLEAGGSRTDAASVVSMSLIAMAIATALQVRRLGPVGAGFLAPHITSAIYLGPSLLAARMGGLGLVFGMTVLAGVLAIAFAWLLRRFRKLFPPELSGVVVLMVGLSMVPVGFTRLVGLGGQDTVSEPAEWGVGLITLGTIIAFSVAPLGRLRLYSTVLGVVTGYAAALVLGVVDLDSFRPLSDLPPVGVHLPVAAPLAWSPLLAVPFIAAALASVVKDAGLVIGCQKANDARWKRPDTRSVSGGVVAAGLGNVGAGLLGGMGLGISGGSVGLARATGATARVLGWFVAGLFVLLAFMPKVTAAVALMPSPVMGAGLIYVACHLVTAGAELITSRMLDARRTYTIGLSLLAGVGALAVPQMLDAVPAWAHAIFANPLALSTMLALTLNVVLCMGVSSRARARVPAGEGLANAVSRFVEQQGAAWGARSDVVRRVVPAIVEWGEEMALAGAPGELELLLEFDEFRLRARVSSADDGVQEEGQPPQVLLEDAARRLARRYDCAVQLLDGGGAQLAFEH